MRRDPGAHWRRFLDYCGGPSVGGRPAGVPAGPKGDLRLWCLGLLPVLGGAFLHVLLWTKEYDLSFGILTRLWTDGLHGEGGGVISGGLAVLCAHGL